MAKPVRVVYDCMIFLQSAARPDRLHGTMRLVRESRVTLCVSPEVLEEVGDVLTRGEITRKFPALTPAHVEAFLGDLLSTAVVLSNIPEYFTLPRDRKDEPYLNLAIHAGARYLVTWNERHLTYLMRADRTEGRDFCQRFRDLKIIDPATFVREIGGLV